ncbi:protein BIC1-like [Phragmites australis]|uniref:protein BIC1-like n=1 Tax=Phragmites australis TaxID=29695 RepID=UPI002D789DCF|nr:protein BIC1-like [Phragmites australis]
MAPSNSEPCMQRPPAEELQSETVRDAASEERTTVPAAGTSESDPTRPEPAKAERKKDRAAEDAESGVELARRPPVVEESARERLKRHRTEMAGRVRIPDMWGQERLLKDWVDCAVFDHPLAATTGLLTARDALIAECAAARRPAHGSTGRPLRVQNGCL